MKKMSIIHSLLLLCLMLSASALAQNNNSQDKNQNATNDSRRMQTQVASGQKMKINGLILRRDNNTIVVRDKNGSEINVTLTGNTKVEEKKGNPFRGAKKYGTDQVIRGLYAEIEGRGDATGSLVAEKIKFSNDAQRTAQIVDSQVTPVENRVGQAETRLTTSETRLTEAERNAQRMSGQLEELTQVANLAKGGAAAAQQTADAAVEGVNKTNDRITSLDDYDEKSTQTVNFKVGSAWLSPEAKAQLDQVAAQAKNEKGYVIEVRGFASAEGSNSLNDRLSEQRADAVMRYLAQHEIPLRRIVMPFGYGKAMPVADNSTRAGRQQNRRVEVKILVSKGLTTPATVTRPATSTTETQSKNN